VLIRLVHDVADSGIVLLGLGINAARACLHPGALLVAGRPAERDTRLLIADLGAALLVYAPLGLPALARRRARPPLRAA
jgi:hypothetical protein